MSIILTHGANSLGGGSIPELLYATDDFYHWHVGSPVESTVTESNTYEYNMDVYTAFKSGVISYNYNYWINAHKRYCDISSKTVTLQIPFDKVDTVSIQFYYTLDEDNGSRLYVSNLLHLFGYYNDKSAVTDVACIPSDATTYNNAQLNNGDWGVTRTPVVCRNLGSPVWSYISMVCKKNADSTWQIYLYLNSTLYYSWTKSSFSNNFVLSTGDTQCNIYLMEFMVYTINRAADDYSAYSNNDNYKPMY